MSYLEDYLKKLKPLEVLAPQATGAIAKIEQIWNQGKESRTSLVEQSKKQEYPSPPVGTYNAPNVGMDSPEIGNKFTPIPSEPVITASEVGKPITGGDGGNFTDWLGMKTLEAGEQVVKATDSIKDFSKQISESPYNFEEGTLGYVMERAGKSGWGAIASLIESNKDYAENFSQAQSAEGKALALGAGAVGTAFGAMAVPFTTLLNLNKPLNDVVMAGFGKVDEGVQYFGNMYQEHLDNQGREAIKKLTDVYGQGYTADIAFQEKAKEIGKWIEEDKRIAQTSTDLISMSAQALVAYGAIKGVKATVVKGGEIVKGGVDYAMYEKEFTPRKDIEGALKELVDYSRAKAKGETVQPPTKLMNVVAELTGKLKQGEKIKTDIIDGVEGATLRTKKRQFTAWAKDFVNDFIPETIRTPEMVKLLESKKESVQTKYEQAHEALSWGIGENRFVGFGQRLKQGSRFGVEIPAPLPEVRTKAIADNALREEAKKYKSAEEFVKAQGEPVYHGTQAKFDKFDSKFATDAEGRKLNLGWGKGNFYFTTKKGEALKYATRERSPEVAKLYLKGEPNVVEAFVDIKNPFDIGSAKNAERWRKVRDGYWSDGVSDFNYHKIPKGKTKAEAFVEQLKKEGYDGIIDGQEITAFSESSIKTKSQLTDIWNEANKSTPKVEGLGAEIQKAKAEGKTFDEWVKEQGTGNELYINTIGTKTGEPVVLKSYHGTNAEFENFIITEKGVRYSGDGVYFTPSKSDAGNFGKNVKEVYLDLKKPYVKYLPEGNIDQQFNELAKEVKAEGYDSIIVRMKDTDTVTKKVEGDFINEIVVFDTNAIKTKSQLQAEWDSVGAKLPTTALKTDGRAYLGGDKKLTPQELYARSEKTSTPKEVKSKFNQIVDRVKSKIPEFENKLDKLDTLLKTPEMNPNYDVTEAQKVNPLQRTLGEAQAIKFKVNEISTTLLGAFKEALTPKELKDIKVAEAITAYRDSKTPLPESLKKLQPLMEKVTQVQKWASQQLKDRGLVERLWNDESYVRHILEQKDGSKPTASQLAELEVATDEIKGDLMRVASGATQTGLSTNSRFYQERLFKNIPEADAYLSEFGLQINKNFFDSFIQQFEQIARTLHNDTFVKSLRTQAKAGVKGVKEIYDPAIYKEKLTGLAEEFKAIKEDVLGEMKKDKQISEADYNKAKEDLYKDYGKLKKGIRDDLENMDIREALDVITNNFKAFKDKVSEGLSAEKEAIGLETKIALDVVRSRVSPKEYAEIKADVLEGMKLDKRIAEYEANKEVSINKELFEKGKEALKVEQESNKQSIKERLDELQLGAGALKESLYKGLLEVKENITLGAKARVDELKNKFDTEVSEIKKDIIRKRAKAEDEGYTTPEDIILSNQIRGIMLSKPLARSLKNVMADKPTLSSVEDAIVLLKTAQLTFDIFKVKELVESSIGVGAFTDPVTALYYKNTAEYAKRAEHWVRHGISVDAPIDINVRILEDLGKTKEVAETESYFLKTLRLAGDTKAGAVVKYPFKKALVLEQLQFETLMPAFKVMGADALFNKLKKQNPTVPEEDLAFQVADFINNAFQGQNWEQILAKNPHITYNRVRLIRALSFGPDKITSVLRLPASAFKTGNKLLGAKIYFKYMFRALLTGGIITEILNYMLNGHSTLENTKGNELSVELPNMEDEQGNPLSVQIFGSAIENVKMLNQPISYFRNKVNPIVGSFLDFFSPQYGKIDYERVAGNLVPLPINLQSIVSWAMGQLFDSDGTPQYGRPEEFLDTLGIVGMEFAGFPTTYRTGKGKATMIDVLRGNAVIIDVLQNTTPSSGGGGGKGSSKGGSKGGSKGSSK